VVQQGINTEDKSARRYHWLSENVKDFVVDPHNAVVDDVKQDAVLDMTAKAVSATESLLLTSPRKNQRS